MFCLAEFEDHVCLPPTEIGIGSRLESVRRLLRMRCLDKVVEDAGHAVCLGDVLEIGTGILQPGKASVDLPVRFTLVLFRPFLGEVIVGKLARCDESGLFVTLEFFDDIFIPARNLPEPSEFDKNERLWVWKGGDEEGNDLPLDLGEVIRFRVSNVIFQEQEKDSLNSVRIRTKDNGHEESMDMSWDKDGEVFMGTSGNFAPMVVMGDINLDGLGLLRWWTDVDEEYGTPTTD